jgi:hypothetical protein
VNLDVELFNDGQKKRKLVAHLCHRRDLPIYRSAIDPQLEVTRGIKSDVDVITGEDYLRIIEWPEYPYVTDEVGELLDVIDELIEERDVERAESRSIDSGGEVFQILARTVKPQANESREDDTCYGWWTSSIGARCRRFEMYGKHCEPSQCR